MKSTRNFSIASLELIEFYRDNPVIAAEDLLGVDLDSPQKVVLNEMWFKPYTLVTAGRGCGKCVTGDTLVFTNAGIEYIGSMGNELAILEDIGKRVKSVNGVDDASKWFYDGIQGTNTVLTRYGYSVSGTDNHRVLVLKKNGILSWSYMKDIRPNDIIAIDRHVNLWPATDELSEDLASILGFVVGDSRICGDKDHFRAVPSNVLKATRKNTAVFLRSLFECSGSCENSKVSYSTTSKELCRQIHLMLLNFGVISALRCQEERSVLDIAYEGINTFRKEIGFISAAKNELLDGICSRSPDINLDVVYGLENVFKFMYLRTEGTLTCGERDLYERYESECYTPSYEDLKRSISVYPYNDEAKERIRNLIERHFFFDRVEEVTVGVDKVYDLVVPGGESFVANGLVNHNSFLLSVVSCLYALLYYGKRVLIMGPSFRQSKMVFDEIKKRYTQSPILREACVKKPVVGSDKCYLHLMGFGDSTGSSIDAYPLGDGCLVGSTLITLDTGIVSLGDFLGELSSIEEHQVFKNDSRVWFNGDFVQTDEKYYNGVRPVKKISTKKGYSITGTLGHKIKVVRDGEIVWETLDNIVEGDWVPIDNSERWPVVGSDDISTNDAYVLGLLIGDGNWTSSGRIGFATKDDFFIDKLNSAFEKDFVKAKDNVHFTIYGSKWRQEWLDFWGISCLYTKDKVLPNKLLKSSKGNVAACISGLFDTDGHISTSTSKGGISITVGLTNTSERLIDQVQYILLHFGIISTKSKRDRDPKWNRIYDLIITGLDVIKFNNLIGFKLPRKSESLNSAIESKKKFFNSGDYIPGVLEDVIAFRKNNPVRRGCGCKASSETRSQFLSKAIELTRVKAGYILELYGDVESPIIDKVLNLYSQDVFYDQVGEIEYFEDKTYDIHVPHVNAYCAGGFLVHNSRIRGLRGHFILVDEFAQVPKDVFEMVIRPMGATTTSPMENVRRLKTLKDKLKNGFLSYDEYQQEIGGMQANKIAGVTSAYYQFNHVYDRILKYSEQIERGSDKYGLCTVSYKDMSEGFLDTNNVEEARTTMSSVEFSLEYEAIWESDSAGFFKASLVEECKSKECPVRPIGQLGKKYIIGVDPARSSDAFALVVIEMGNPSYVVNAFQIFGEKFPKMAQIIYNYYDNFDTKLVIMDAGSGGGGVAIKDILSSEQFSKGRLILDIDDPEHDRLSGDRVLRMHDPRPKSLADANYAALNLLEQGLLKFPVLLTDFSEDKENIFFEIKEMLSQLVNIVVTETKSGVAHFDLPTTGKGSKKKDLYSAFILAAKGLYDIVIAREEENCFVNRGGLVVPVDRLKNAPVISSIMKFPDRR